MKRFRTYHSIATFKVSTISPRAQKVYTGVKWLLRRQNRNGSWGKGGSLDRLICTCQTIMTLLDAGIPADHPSVERGIKWLIVGEGASSSFSFWRLGPLLRLSQYRDLVEDDLRHLDELLAQRSNPIPAQILEVFQLSALRIAGHTNNRIRQYISVVLDEWTEYSCWRGRALATAQALAVLSDYEFENKTRIFEIGKQFIKIKADREGELTSWGGRVSDTSYIVIRISESLLADDPEIRELAGMAVNWLEAQMNKKGYWRGETPPYGGDVTSNEYFTSLALRALIAYSCLETPFFPLEIAKCGQDEASRIAKLRGYLNIAMMMFLLSGLIFSLRDYISAILAAASTVVSVVIMILSLVTGFIALYEFIRRKSSSTE